MSKLLSNLFLSMAKTASDIRNNKLRIVIKDHKITTKFVDPKKVSADGRTWDDFYSNACLYVGNYANPVKIDKTEAENRDIELISSERFKEFMTNKIVEQAFNTQYQENDLMLYLLIANLCGMLIVIVLIMSLMA